MHDRKSRGSKRKLHACNNNLLAKSGTTWVQRKPKHLKVSNGFLPNDSKYITTELNDKNLDDYLDDLDDPNQRHVLHNRSKYMQCNRPVYVIDYTDPRPKNNGHFSKFHSLLQILVGLYDEENKCFVPRKLALLASNTLSSTHESIFDLDVCEFVYEYQHMKRLFPHCAIHWIEKGLELYHEHELKRISGVTLLRYLFTFLKEHRFELSRRKSAMSFINKECLLYRSKSRLHFDCLCLLKNAEEEALKADGVVFAQKDFSAFDLLQDVWICCFNALTSSYFLRYLSKNAWDKYNEGADIILEEFSKEVISPQHREELQHFATIAARHYDFYGFTFVMPEDSLLYKQFRTNRINA